MSYCETCGEPLCEFELCSYGDLCMFCYDRQEEEDRELEEDEEP